MAKPRYIGLMDELIDLYKAVKIENDIGEDSKEWEPYSSNVWASVIDFTYYKKMQEVADGNVVDIDKSLKFVIGYNPEIKEGHRVLYDGKYYEVITINKIKKTYQTELICNFVKYGSGLET